MTDVVLIYKCPGSAEGEERSQPGQTGDWEQKFHQLFPVCVIVSGGKGLL